MSGISDECIDRLINKYLTKDEREIIDRFYTNYDTLITNVQSLLINANKYCSFIFHGRADDSVDDSGAKRCMIVNDGHAIINVAGWTINKKLHTDWYEIEPVISFVEVGKRPFTNRDLMNCSAFIESLLESLHEFTLIANDKLDCDELIDAWPKKSNYEVGIDAALAYNRSSKLRDIFWINWEIGD